MGAHAAGHPTALPRERAARDARLDRGARQVPRATSRRASRWPIRRARASDRRGGGRRAGDAPRCAAYERRDVLLALRAALPRARRGARAGALHRGRQADPRQPRRGHAPRSTRSASPREEATRIGGEVLPMDITPRATGLHRRCGSACPIGPCSFITPFNFPLNLVAHKVAPAIAAGCPFVLKPASATPLGALLIGEVLAETGAAEGRVLDPAAARARLGAAGHEDERFKLLSFTGSPDVGWELKGRAGQEEGRARARRQRGVIVDRDARPRRRRRTHRRSAPSTSRARAASRRSASSCTRRSTRASASSSSRHARR